LVLHVERAAIVLLGSMSNFTIKREFGLSFALARPTRTKLRARSSSVRAGLTLYSNPRSRSKIIEWYLKEIGVEYYSKHIEMTELRSPEFLAVNPAGLLPAITDDGLNVVSHF
jgi:Glutathione S-transferase, N-terminal domain